MNKAEFIRPAKAYAETIASVSGVLRRIDSHDREQILWRYFRHGVQVALFAKIYFTVYPGELKQDTSIYDNLNLGNTLLGVCLHDVGKAVNSEMWNLNPRQFKTSIPSIKHPHFEAGYILASLLEKLDRLHFHPVVYDIILMHHERRNGTGPYKKVAANIPHVVQCVTVFDNLISPCQAKTYQESGVLTLNQAFGKLSQQREEYYHPVVLENVRHLLVHNRHLQEPGLRWMGKYEEASLLGIQESLFQKSQGLKSL